MILAGDIGGTHTRLALFEGDRPLAEQTYASGGAAGLLDLVAAFRAAHPGAVAAAAFGVAGPVVAGRVQATNLPWVVDRSELARALGTERVALVNDLEANGYGIAALAPADFAVLNAGAPAASGHAAVISAGTGLGEAGLFWDGARHRPFASEGGHADFAPRDEVDLDLWRFLAREHGHVSWERVLSGPGLVNIYRCLREMGRAEEPPDLAARLADADPAAVIAEAALAGSPPICVAALDRFVGYYGAEAGNLALKLMATGGVYLGGGIAPRILPKLRGPAFTGAFAGKGRLRPVLEAIPLRVILNDRCALLGAARLATELLSHSA